jgi:hypothetical protein
MEGKMENGLHGIKKGQKTIEKFLKDGGNTDIFKLLGA